MHNSCFVRNTRDGTDINGVLSIVFLYPQNNCQQMSQHLLYLKSCCTGNTKQNKYCVQNIVYTIPVYTVLPSVLVPRYTAPSVATNYIGNESAMRTKNLICMGHFRLCSMTSCRCTYMRAHCAIQ